MVPEIFHYLLIVLCILQSSSVYSQSDMKSSLTFVLDNTGSMWDDIDAVKKGANDIFDTVMNSNESQIEDFVLVIFNDPQVNLLIVTRDRVEFKSRLASIDISGGDDCPEMSMGGVEKALEVSRDGSSLYVFTDASAKDPHKYEHVKQLAVDKGCKVVFVLTGTCSNYEGNSDVYYNLANETDGQVFNFDKNNVGKILNFVKETIKSRKSVVAKKIFPAGSHKLNYTVDGNMKELVISVTGTHPKVDVIDPYGNEAETEDIVRTDRIAIVKVVEVKPGVYMAEVKSDSKTTVVVSGTNTVHFEHGFSQFEPTAIEETSLQPIPDEKSYLSVKVNVEGGAVDLQSIQILDLDQSVIMEKLLYLINVKEQFYVTSESIIPPNKSFRIAIKGFDVESKSIFTRFGLTPIEPQDIKKVEIKNKVPVVMIIGKSEVNAAYEEPLELKCRVSGYPKPNIIWEDDDGVLSATNVTQVLLPYDYVSLLEIDSINKNNTYKCKGKNDLGEDSKEIYVRTKRTKYFDVEERPKDSVIKYGEEGRFVCKVNAAPEPATIKWYREKKKIQEGLNYHISSDGSVLTINSMEPYLDGEFRCIARNNRDKKVFNFKVSTSGIETPKIDKEVNEIYVRRGSNATVACKIIQGKPKPNIRWFFMPKDTRKVKLIKGDEELFMSNVGLADAGTFRCEASNAAGEDFHYNDLIVEYPPVIRGDSLKTMRAVDGENVKLPCDVDGVPDPSVKWFINGAEIKKKGPYHFHTSHTLSFKATMDTSGNYTCEAVNDLGAVTSKAILLHITIPVNIEAPKQSSYEVSVGGNLTLECVADGFPEPNIRWIFHDVDFDAPAKSLDAKGSLEFSRIQANQEGYYTCIASNVGSSANITYEVKVLAPPTIINVKPDKKFTAVEEDLTLRVSCKTAGSPKPTINWIKDTFSIAAGTQWYDIEDDGSLIIKNVEKASEGSYTCEATNSLGSARESYNVFVDDYPKPGPPKKTIVIEEGKASRVPCDVPHKIVDSLRWYKDGKKITSGELTLRNVTTADSGVYTCRVSTFVRSTTGNTLVKVGFKPKFTYDEESHIEFADGVAAVLDCTATAEPAPEVSWWYGGHQFKERRMTYVFDMKMEKRGTYFCLVKNEYGHVVRSFEISSEECSLNIETDFGGNWPMIVSNDLKWPAFDIIDGYLRIPPKENVVLSCPEEFEKFDKDEIVATCDKGNNFTVDGHIYQYSDLKCKDEFEPIAIQTDEVCYSDDTEIIKIGFEVRDEFLEVYEVCLDKNRNLPVYAKHTMQRSLADTDLKNTKWFDSDLLPHEFDEMYDCEFQSDWISSVLQTDFHSSDLCCFSKRQLISTRDVLPGLSQLATYSHLNVVPHWSSCNAKNWEIVERRVRKLMRTTGHPLVIWTGTSDILRLRGARHLEDILISDEDNQKQSVPLYLWKVVQDPETRSSLAIIQVNVPDLKQRKAHNYVHCRDICSEVKWMKNSSWRNVHIGYTYCCSIEDFKAAFGFDELFGSGFERILR